ncbi:MAG: LPS export ABC transporter ATP-binding protein, partial [Caldilineaceae bacterium]|nr:LPS export ABC transporter ATP-binding protein [Caldilineaceae bacterium]
LGPNGAGKTTVFYMITGLVPADAGTITLDGADVTRMPMYQRARLGIGYLPQEASIFRGLSVEDNVRAVLEVVEKSRKQREIALDALLEEFHIAHLRKAPSVSLSGGERRRLEIARALASKPSYMLLDEPFAGIDPIAVSDIQRLVRHLTARGIGVIGMKSLGGSGQLITGAGLTAEQCRRYSLTLPISTLVCGIESLENLRQDVEIARNFTPMTDAELQALQDSVFDEATDGRHEWFKSTQYYDSQYHRDQHGFPPINSVGRAAAPDDA